MKDVVEKLESQNQLLKATATVGHFLKPKQIKPEQIKEALYKQFDNLGKYEHCSMLIHYEKAEEDPVLLNADDFKKKTLENALIVNNITFKQSDADFFTRKDDDFFNILNYIDQVHGVLPYASESKRLHAVTRLVASFTCAASL
tara:strand:+ start:186 stop:617 length:432 start_codon:yes stop_codon:yes gene_type:complete